MRKHSAPAQRAGCYRDIASGRAASRILAIELQILPWPHRYERRAGGLDDERIKEDTIR